MAVGWTICRKREQLKARYDMEPGVGVFHELMWLPPGDREDRAQTVGLVGMLSIFSLPIAKESHFRRER